MNWTQPICLDCFRKRYPDRGGAAPVDPENDRETCCDCGEKTQHGIWFRVDPRTVKHPTND